MRLSSRAVLAVVRSTSVLVGTAGVSASPRHDPAQVDRFRDIIDNLRGRIGEAEHDAWLGEAEGLEISAAAENKVAALGRQNNLPRTLLSVSRLARHGGSTW